MSDNVLASWNDGASKSAVVDFVARVTEEGGTDFIPPVERIAVFDNDGTLWCEKPMPIELGFILQRLAAMAEKDPSLRERQPWKAAYEKDYAWLGDVITKHYHGDDSDVKVLIGGILKAFDGMSVDRTRRTRPRRSCTSAQHPTLKRAFRDCGYEPMVELLRYLEAHGFTNYIASGGDRDFMRAVTQRDLRYPARARHRQLERAPLREDADGGSIVYLARPDVFDDGPAKPVRIWSRIGRRPILAVGNSNGDIQMLQFAGGTGRPGASPVAPARRQGARVRLRLPVRRSRSRWREHKGGRSSA